MGRVKLQIKRIENPTSRQVTFSKRRNGLIKKAYELSTLCDVDLALIMFSPSGRLSLFSGKKRIDDILNRYVNLPEHERGRLQNQESILRMLDKLKQEHDVTSQSAASVPRTNLESQIEDLQNEIYRCQYLLEDAEKRLRMFQGDAVPITSLSEAECYEQIFREGLNHVRLQKETLEGRLLLPNIQSCTQVFSEEQDNANVSGCVTGNPTPFTERLPLKDPQVQIMDFLGSNGLLPIRDQAQSLTELLSSQSTLIDGSNFQEASMTSSNGVYYGTCVSSTKIGGVPAINMSHWSKQFPAENLLADDACTDQTNERAESLA